MTLQEMDKVRLRRPIPADGLKVGDIGRIFVVCDDGTYLVDFDTDGGEITASEMLSWPDDIESVSGRPEVLQSLGIAYTAGDDLDGDGNFAERIRRRYSGVDAIKTQQFLPLAASLLSATEPLAELERLILALSGYGEVFNLCGALSRLADPRVQEFADRGLQIVEREMGVWLLESAPDGADAVTRFDALPRGDVLARASEAYLALKVAGYTEGVDPIVDAARYQTARDKAVAHVQWRRELRNGSASEFRPTSASAQHLAGDGHLLPAYAIALVAIAYRDEATVPDHYFWTYYPAIYRDLESRAFFFNALRPSQTQGMIRRLVNAERAAQGESGYLANSTFPPELDSLRYIPAAAEHFQEFRSDSEFVKEFAWMFGR